MLPSPREHARDGDAHRQDRRVPRARHPVEQPAYSRLVPAVRLRCMAGRVGTPHFLRVDGGAATNDTLMQLQADLMQATMERPAMTETTALGAAFLAGLAVGVWSGTEELERQRRIERRFEPRMNADAAAQLRGRWNEAVERARGWITPGPAS